MEERAIEHPENACPAEIVTRLEQERVRATLHRDFASLNALLDNSLVYTHSTGAINTKSSYLAAIERSVWDYRQIELLNQRFVTHGDTVLAFYRMKADLLVSGVPKVVDSLVLAAWVLTKSGYRLAALHSSPGRSQSETTFDELQIG